MGSSPNGGMEGFPNGDVNGPQQQDGSSVDGLNVGSFLQPFVPQDLWQMPMTLEWDWADMGGAANGYPAAFEGAQGQGNGINGQGSMQ